MHFSFFFSPFSQVKKGCTTSNSTTKRLTESKRRSSEHHGCTMQDGFRWFEERGIHAYLRGRKKERVMVVALGLSFTKLRPSEVRSSPFFFLSFSCSCWRIYNNIPTSSGKTSDRSLLASLNTSSRYSVYWLWIPGTSFLLRDITILWII